jgi:hypothetical protein
MFVFQIHKYICHYLAWLLFMKHPGYNLTWHSIRHQYSSTYPRSDSISNHIDIHHPKCPTASIPNNIANINKQPFLFSVRGETLQTDSVPKINVTPALTLQHAHSDHHLSTASHPCEKDIIHSELRTIVSRLTIVTNYVQRQERHDNASQDWKFVAMVIDRLCLILFSILITIFTCLIFLSALNFYNLR